MDYYNRGNKIRDWEVRSGIEIHNVFEGRVRCAINETYGRQMITDLIGYKIP